MKYDLEERCAKFGENIILFLSGLKKDEINRPLVGQLIRSATSIGANYMEANQAASKKDFINKTRNSQKEANESKHWLRMIAVASPNHKESCRKHWQEAHELTLIFAKISKS
ncbi:MAG: four helix bundle protein [Candidatus Yanofskybacteria bacterium]|nr:four helix bundle protein [Candidatus Yanofskybacteria bacterium]